MTYKDKAGISHEAPAIKEDLIKLFTGPTFNKTGFVNMLIDKMGVKAYAVPDGVILDRHKFNECPAAYMPVWAWLNKEDINSPLHTVKVVKPW